MIANRGGESSGRAPVGDGNSRDRHPGTFPAPTWVTAGAAALLFAAVWVLRSASDDPQTGLALLYVVPVVLLALRFGLGGGLAGGAVASVLTAFDANPSIDLPFVGYLTRFGMLLGIGALVGSFVARERRLWELREASRERVRRFFDLSKDMLCTASSDGYFVELNPAWQETLGYTEEELRARPFFELVHPEDRERTERRAARVVEGDAAVSFENRYLAKDGKVHWLHWSSSAGPDGLIYARATDITERRQAEEDLRDLSEALVRSNEELRQFAYIASHDLSEPLRTISGFAQLVEKRYASEVDDRGREYIGRMVGGVERMQQMIRDLLAFSRAGRAVISRVPVDIQDVVTTVLTDLERAVVESGARVRAEGLPTVEGDESQLHQLFQNLISNALKFTDGRDPRVEISAVEEANAWRFSVADNGIGIDPDQRERVFEAFERLHSRDDYAGTGIGLAISKKIVERHGGEIQAAEGLEGQGTGFVFTIARD